MKPIRLSVLGRLRIELGGVDVEGLTAVKARALLVHLAVRDRPHSRQSLAGLLWPDVPESSARASLRGALLQLNKALPGSIFADRRTIGLAAGQPRWMDAAVLEDAHAQLRSSSLPLRDEERSQARKAVHLYRGDFLDDFIVEGADLFDEWMAFQRERYRRLVLQTLDFLAADALGRAAYAEGIEEARRMLDLEPAHEPAHRQLMLLLAKSGDRTAALGQFDVCRTVLQTELGVEPDEATLDLVERIGARNVTADSSSPEILIAPPREVDVCKPAFLDPDEHPAHSQDVRFVARIPQLSHLFASLEDAIGGQSQVRMVAGYAGAGKSYLVHEFARQAQARHPDLIVAFGLCDFYSGVGDPFLPFREIMRMLTGDVEQLWASGSISRQHAMRLWRLLPTAISALVSDATSLLGTFVDVERLAQRLVAYDSDNADLQNRLRDATARVKLLEQEQLFHDFGVMLQRLATSHPLLLIVDDLHWADSSSIGLLHYLGRRLTDDRIMIVGAYRPEQARTSDQGRFTLWELIGELKRRHGDCVLDLDEVGADEQRRLVDGLVNLDPNRLDSAFEQALYHKARGNPLFTRELLQDLKDRNVLVRDTDGFWVQNDDITWAALPARLEGVIEKRLRQLTPEMQRALRTASVQGEEFWAELVAHISGIDERQFVQRLGDVSRRSRLVEARGHSQVSDQRLSQYRFGHNLFQHYLYNSLDDAERAYLHQNVARELEEVYGDDTGPVAIHLAQHYEAAGMADKAAYFWRQAGQMSAESYANAEAIAAFRRALHLSKGLLSSPVRVGNREQSRVQLRDIYTRLGRSLEIDSQWDQAKALYQEMVELGRSAQDDRLRLAGLVALATLHVTLSPARDLVLGERLLQDALNTARALSDEQAEARILWLLLTVYTYTGRIDQAHRSGEASLAIARKGNMREQMAYTLSDLGAHLYWLQVELDKAQSVLHESATIWRELDNRPMLADSLAGLAMNAAMRGEYRDAIDWSEEAYQLSLSIDNLWGQSYSRFRAGIAHWEQGRIDRAIAMMEEAIKLSDRSGFSVPKVVTRTDLVQLYAELGAFDLALKQAEKAVHAAEALGAGFLSEAAGAYAYAHALRGDLASAAAFLARGKSDQNRASTPMLYIPVVLAGATIELRVGNPARARASAAELLQIGARALAPRALYLTARAWQTEGDIDHARDAMSSAYQEARSLEADWPLWQICYALSRLDQDINRSEGYYRQSKVVLERVIASIPIALRSRFLARPDVESVLRTRS